MNLSVLSGCRLFAYVPADALPALLDAVGAYTRRYDKGQPVCRMGDTVRALGVVLSGSVTIERDDVWGNKTILDRAAPGMVFAETYACVPDTPMMVSAVAAEASEVLFIPADALLAPAAPPDAGRLALLRGLLAVSARKNLTLTRKIVHTSPKSLRSWLLLNTDSWMSIPSGYPMSRPRRRCSTAATPSTSPLTASSWRTIWAPTAARCPASWAGCGGTACSTSAKTISSCTAAPRRTNDPNDLQPHKEVFPL